jgi:hypothetical protein
MGVIKDISSILMYGEMSTSYKHATLLALFDYIAEQPSEAAAKKSHFISSHLLLLKREISRCQHFEARYSPVARGRRGCDGRACTARRL